MSSRTQPKRNRGALSSDRMFNSTSPITSKDIQSFLAICVTNWSSYTEEEKKTIISKMPLSHQSFNLDDRGNLLCPVTASFMAKDRVVRDNIATFQREVSDGYYTKSWQERARKAMQERAEGRFDEYLRFHAEEVFGENADDNMNEDDSDSDGNYGAQKRGRKETGKQSKMRGKGKKTVHGNCGRRIAADFNMDDADN